MRRMLLAMAVFAAATLAAGEALAAGACVYVTLERGAKKIVCEKVGAKSVCDNRGIGGGTYHADETCKDHGHEEAQAPAKPRFDAIPSPLKPPPAKPSNVHPEYTDRWKGDAPR